jgi:hypothetical protein
MWEQVTERFNSEKDERAPNRDVDAIRNKFKHLKNVPKPTGDPTCPPNVIRAKRIAKEIEEGECVFQCYSSENSDEEESEASSRVVVSASESSDCDEGNTSPVAFRKALNPDQNVLIAETVHPFVVPDSFLPNGIIEDAQDMHVYAGGRESQSENSDAEELTEQPKRKSKSKGISSQAVAPRLGTDAAGLQGVMEMLRKKKTMDKQGINKRKIPTNPQQAKKKTIANSIQEIDDQFSKSQDLYHQQFLLTQQASAVQQQEERRWREDERRRLDEDRRLSEEKREDERRRLDEDRRRSDQRFELECQRHAAMMALLISAVNPNGRVLPNSSFATGALGAAPQSDNPQY